MSQNIDMTFGELFASTVGTSNQADGGRELKIDTEAAELPIEEQRPLEDIESVQSAVEQSNNTQSKPKETEEKTELKEGSNDGSNNGLITPLPITDDDNDNTNNAPGTIVYIFYILYIKIYLLDFV